MRPYRLHVLFAAALLLGAASVRASAARRPSVVGDNSAYIVHLHDESSDPAEVLGGDDAFAAAEKQAMTAHDGARFTCYLPPLKAAAASIVGSTSSKDSGQLVPALRELRNALNGIAPCLVGPPGEYWTLEVCPGKRVRQFRKDVEHDLGTFVRDEVTILGGGEVAYAQYFSGGSEGRSARVVLRCDPPGLAAHVDFAIASVREPESLSYDVTVGTRDAELCAHMPSPTRLLRRVNGTCTQLYVPGSWWTYALCVGQSLRQFHDSGAAGQGPVAESVIGTYDWRFGERLDDALAAPAPPPADAVVAGALVQQYGDGSACGVKGGVPRRATVRFVCAPVVGDVTPPPLSILSVREPATCVYDVEVASPHVCAHPRVAPPRRRDVAAAGPTSAIHCFPVQSSR